MNKQGAFNAIMIVWFGALIISFLVNANGIEQLRTTLDSQGELNEALTENHRQQHKFNETIMNNLLMLEELVVLKLK